MEYVDLESSNLSAARLEGNTLYVRFKNGAVYSYSGVPKEVFKELCNTDSVGKYFSLHIKNNYSFRKEE